MSQELLSHAATILPVKDPNVSIPFYRDQLGFDLTFTWEEPISYAVLKRGNVSIHLSISEENQPPTGRHTSIYIFVHDVEKAYQEFQLKGVESVSSLNQQAYGMREFDLVDPDGYVLTFGKHEG